MLILFENQNHFQHYSWWAESSKERVFFNWWKLKYFWKFFGGANFWLFQLLGWVRYCNKWAGSRDSSVQSLSCVQLFATPWTAARQASLSITNSRVYSNSCPLSRWCQPTISSSVIPFSFHLQSFPASGFFPMSQSFASGGQSIGASASVLPMNVQNSSPLGWTGWISLQSKGLLRVFSNTTVQKHQFFSTQLS